MGANELSTLLWRERDLLELLLFKLEEEQLLLTAGRTRWLGHATREVEQVLEKLRAASLSRTLEAGSVAADWGLPEDATLRELAAGAPALGPWRELLETHLAALVALTSSIRQVRDSNLQYLNSASRSTQETLAGLELSAGIYDARGASSPAAAGASTFDTTL
ncbi:flagellar export chaperone FlgN [Georgenia sp. AZ-5]|uniref:flagellar export chaperone FlgN n=1 Tax=Georgenia sp. AZ-5 TaxID=3367526 RepID=UPI00375457C4